MKKLKMIVTSVVVLAIVGGAFAFKAKVGSFCILTSDAAGSDCTTHVDNLKTTSSTGVGITQYKYYQNWDGDPAACTGTNGKCTATVNLKGD